MKKQNHPNPLSKANEIFTKLQRRNLEGNRAICSAKSKFLFSTILDQLEPLLEHIKEYDREIEKLFKSHSDSKLFESLPGAGKRIAPRLLAEWGRCNRSRYADASVVQALAGTSPVLHQSGKMRIVKRRHSLY
ncbi:transposase [Natranaerobius thermophilus]|uniref:transposase n=1 Tax=Natranaerobius thermophilus TaxID=375929 RepID=UPI002F4021A6